MKKTFIASTLALTLGAAGYAVSGHEDTLQKLLT